MSERTFKLGSPHMRGSDIKEWRSFLLERFGRWHIDYPLALEDDYDQATRAATASFMRAWGVESAADAMAEGVTPWWRTKLRDDRRSEAEEARFKSAERVDFRRRLRERYERAEVCYPVPNLISDDWGYHPPVHDGVDLICPARQPLLAICTGRVIRADSGGWWGKGAPSDPAVAAKGDGIIIVRSTVDAGPFRRGMNFGYGHAEGAVVREGELVRAGQHIGYAGLANAWHVHFMINDNTDDRGVGDRDPMPFLTYARGND